MIRIMRDAAPSFWIASVLIGLLVVGAVWIGVFWTVPAQVSKDFDWDRIRVDSTSGFVTRGSMFVTFRTDGPVAANNPMYAMSAALYLTTDGLPDGAVQVEIHSIGGASGAIKFQFPPLSLQDQFFYFSFVTISPVSGSIVPASSGPVGVRAWISLRIDGVDEPAWSQYINSSNSPPETWIDVGPASELFAWLGLKAAAAGLLVAAASQIFQAVESAERMFRKRKDWKTEKGP